MLTTRIVKRVVVGLIDLLILIISLFLALSLRKLSIVSFLDFKDNVLSFSIIFSLNIIIFHMYGLYEKMTTKIYSELGSRVLSSQILAALFGALIFYSLPLFTIAPKLILIIYIIISSLLIFIWRYYARIFIKSKENKKILLVAQGEELFELLEEIKNNKILNVKNIEYIDLNNFSGGGIYTEIKKIIDEKKLNMLAINMHHSRTKDCIPLLYDLLLKNVKVINFVDLYEEVFERISLDNIDAGWFFQNLEQRENKIYEKVKRSLDLIISIPFFILTIPFYPIVYLILKYQDNGDLFFISERIGKNNIPFKIFKFRTMTQEKKENINFADKNENTRVTKFGRFLRKTRIDELPQLWNIIIGDLSLIGPRPEVLELVKEYNNQIPFYRIRHLITPGLSGFAQIFQDQNKIPKSGIGFAGTKIKLSFDIYYLKQKSLLVDISLMIKTIKILIQRTGL